MRKQARNSALIFLMLVRMRYGIRSHERRGTGPDAARMLVVRGVDRRQGLYPGVTAPNHGNPIVLPGSVRACPIAKQGHQEQTPCPRQQVRSLTVSYNTVFGSKGSVPGVPHRDTLANRPHQGYLTCSSINPYSVTNGFSYGLDLWKQRSGPRQRSSRPSHAMQIS